MTITTTARPERKAVDLRVYVAGASADMEPARRAMEQVREAGATITEDWITAIERAGNANSLADEASARKAACDDLKAVRTADVVWITTPIERAHGCGLWVELGAALAYGVPVVISGPQSERSIFASLCERYADADHAFAAVLRRGSQ